MKKFVNTFGLSLFGAVLLALCLGLSNACKKSVDSSAAGTSSGPGANEVWMQNTAFSPVSLTVPVNTTVTWTNKDAMNHNVTSATGLFASGTINSGNTYSYKFTKTGTYSYKCTLHSGMEGTIVINP